MGNHWGFWSREGAIIRSVFKENPPGCRIERGREEESLKAVRRRGPHSCWAGMQPNPGQRLGDGGKGLAAALLPEGLWVVNSAHPTLPRTRWPLGSSKIHCLTRYLTGGSASLSTEAGALPAHLTGCHHMLIWSHCPCVCVCAKSLQLCPTLCNPMDCSPPGSSVHRILQTGILERVTMLSSRGSFQPRDRTCISYVPCIGRLALYYYIKPFLSVKFSGIKHIHKVV